MQLSISRPLNLLDLTLVRFGLVGLINTSIDIFGFMLLATTFGIAVPIANAAAYSVGICSSYTLNSCWTFGNRFSARQHCRRFGLFLLANAAGLILSTCLVVFFLTFMDEFAAKVLSVPIVFVWNYVASKYLVFRTNEIDEENASSINAGYDDQRRIVIDTAAPNPEKGISINGANIASLAEIRFKERESTRDDPGSRPAANRSPDDHQVSGQTDEEHQVIRKAS